MMASKQLSNELIKIFEFTIAELQISLSLYGKNQLDAYVNASRNKFLN